MEEIKENGTDIPVCPSIKVFVSGRLFYFIISLFLCFSLSSRAHGPALLEAFPAKHRPSLGRPEGNCGFLPTLRTVRLRLRTHRSGMSPATAAFGPLRFTGLTSLALVLEALVGEKHLFAACEDALRT